MSLIELNNICFSYTSSKRILDDFYLDNISLRVVPGEFISILGPNGSGKSTLLKIIAGILAPQKGETRLKGNAYSSFSRKNIAKIIAFVPQSTLSIFQFSIFEIVMMGRTPYLNFLGVENQEDKQIVEEALELTGIAHLKNKGIHEVSGGEAQRAFIARAIVQKPEIILLDEPNAHLDIKHQLSIFNLIKELNFRQNVTVISISHDLNLAGFYSDRVILMKKGEILKDDRTARILTKENISEVFEVDSEVSVNNASNKVNVTIKPMVL